MSKYTVSARTVPSPSIAVLAGGDCLDPRNAQAVAALCDRRMAALSRGELISVIAAFQHYWTAEDLTGRLPFAEDGTLLRLAYLARECCRVRSGSGGGVRRDSETHAATSLGA